MLIKMKAIKGFTNARIAGPREHGDVLPGETFETDWLHAKELAAAGLATAEDARALETEPTEPVAPHPGLSVAQHKTINDRREKSRKTEADAVGSKETKPADPQPAEVKSPDSKPAA